MEGNVYVGNLPNDVNNEEIQDLFAQYGNVKSVKLINDRETGAFRGFGFVEMSSLDEANRAIEELNGYTMDEKQLRVNHARRRETRPNNNFRRNNFNNRRKSY